MTNLTIYNDSNSQEITLSGLVDADQEPVSTAAVTGELTRTGAALDGGDMTFAAVSGTPGNYTAILNGFDAPAGKAELEVSGSNSGVTFNFSIFVTIANRSL